jgi:hypothetical protein
MKGGRSSVKHRLPFPRDYTRGYHARSVSIDLAEPRLGVKVRSNMKSDASKISRVEEDQRTRVDGESRRNHNTNMAERPNPQEF